MRKVIISALAIAAFGATFVGTRTANAEGWVPSGWNPFPGTWPFSTSEGFAVSVLINTPTAPLATSSHNTTGPIYIPTSTHPNCGSNHNCPTTHWAVTLCSDNTFLSGPMQLAYSTQATYSTTFITTGFGAGYWTSSGGSITPDTGYCPSGTNMSAGGVFVYNY
jgi:hypothetical protein